VKLAAVLVLAIAACGESSSPGQPDAARQIDGAVNMSTALTATMMATRTLDRAFYGVNADDGTLHVEINKGGDTGCPQMNSPTPDYTVIIGRVPAMTAATGTSTGNFLDYQGDMLPGGVLGAPATAVSLTAISYTVGASVALDVNLTFAAGTVVGHVFATHCASLDG
jgi:hypothetical protein